MKYIILLIGISMFVLVGCETQYNKMDLIDVLDRITGEYPTFCTTELLGYYEDGTFIDINLTSDVPAGVDIIAETRCSAERLGPNNPDYFCEYNEEGEKRCNYRYNITWYNDSVNNEIQNEG